MKTPELTSANFDSTLSSTTQPGLVDFYAEGCGPCRMTAPLIDLIATILSEGMAEGQVRAGPPSWMALLVYNLVSTTVHSQLLAEEAAIPDRQRRSELAVEIWEFCRRAIAV